MAEENNIWDLLPGTDVASQEDEANQEQEDIKAASEIE